jgi:hypothetical protein
MSDLKYVSIPNQHKYESIEEAIEFNEEAFLRYYMRYALTHKEIFFSEMEDRAEFLDAARAYPKSI